MKCLAGENAKLEKETQCGMVVCADDPKLLEKLDKAAEKGEVLNDIKILVTSHRSVLSLVHCHFQSAVILTFNVAGFRVLVTHLERAVPTPQFLARLTRPAGCRLPGFKKHGQLIHPEFCLFLSTQLPVQLFCHGKKTLFSWHLSVLKVQDVSGSVKVLFLVSVFILK